jgi:hypothetical protein
MPRSSTQARLLVDGYNIIGAWTSLQQVRDLSGLEIARQDLTELMINYSACENYQTEVVFDAYSQNTPTAQEEVSKLLSVCYTAFGETADTYIEKVCAAYSQQISSLCPRLIVATSDRAQQLTVAGYGAEWISAERLMQEVELSARQFRRKHRPRKQSRGRFLINSLDPQSQKRLAQLRQGL